MRRTFLLAVVAVHVALLLGGLRQNFVTVDEVGHVPAGLHHWETATFALYRVNPPLPRMLAALAMLPARPQTAYQRLTDAPGLRAEWPVGIDFANANGPRYFDLVCLARLPGVLWSLLGAWVVYRWARELYGEAAGCLGVVLWCFEPTVCAFAQLVVPDLPATVAGLTATYVFWRYLRRPTLGRAWLAGFCLGVAQLTKFTLLVLYPVWLLLWVVYRLRPPAPDRPAPPWPAVLGHASLVVGLSVGLINLGYACHESGRRLGDIPFVSRTLAGEPADPATPRPGPPPSNRFSGSWLGSLVVPLPADYVRGMDVQKKDFEGNYWSYLRGEWRRGGWWYYYLYALAVKVPLGLWALVLWAAALTLRRHRGGAPWQDELALWLPAAAVLALVSSQTGFNHHMRYVLPAFPLVLVSTCKLARYLGRERRKAGALVAALVLWFLGSGLAVHPHSLSYFNEAAGGPDRGAEYLVDSNIDWGQDLLFLKKWLDEHPEARPLGLAYYNLVDPRLVGIAFQLPPRADDPDYVRRWRPSPGYYAVDVNFVRGGTFFVFDGEGRLGKVAVHDYEYFRFFRPIAKAGYSIFIYHITLEDANRFRRARGLPLLPPDGVSGPGAGAS
jgi:hypothetical protein